jgi:Putative HNHc nuclease
MTAQRIIRPQTAFSIASTKQKRPRVEDKQHLAWIRTLICCICGKPGSDPAHIRSSNAIYGKPETGGQAKASDKWTVPLCRVHHDEQHDTTLELSDTRKENTAELRWWASKGIDPFGLALALHAASGDDEIAHGIIRANQVRA